jgi:hypothetical protein
MFLRGLTFLWASLWACLLALVVLSPISASAQTTVVRDPQALALLNQSLSVLTGGTSVTDVTLQAASSLEMGRNGSDNPVSAVASEVCYAR